MRLIGISLGNRRGDLELCGRANVATGEVMFQVLANGLVFCETPYYEDARAVLMDVFDLNQPAKKENLQ